MIDFKIPYGHVPPSWENSLNGSAGDVDVSVNMIVRNEEERLARVLASLIPLRPKEVIVADTGSTDRTREIATWFGAKVIEVPWNDHFSEARNAVLDVSKYEWIVWIDADEQFAEGSAERLRTKIRTGQLKNDYQLFVYSEHPYQMFQSRMFRKIPEARWQGRVHENVWPTGPVQSHDDIVIIQHPDDRRPDKYLRNLQLLERAIEEEPLNARNYMHATILYILTENHKKAEVTADAYLQLSKREELKPRVYMLYAKAWMAMMQKNFQAAANFVLAGLAMDVTAAELWCLLGDIYQWVRRPQDALAAYENAILFGKTSTGTFWMVDRSKYDQYPQQMIDKLKAQGITRPPRMRMSFGPETP